MGCCGGNKTHPEGKDSPDFGYDYEYDQRYDYDSGVSSVILSRTSVDGG